MNLDYQYMLLFNVLQIIPQILHNSHIQADTINIIRFMTNAVFLWDKSVGYGALK